MRRQEVLITGGDLRIKVLRQFCRLMKFPVLHCHLEKSKRRMVLRDVDQSYRCSFHDNGMPHGEVDYSGLKDVLG